MIKRSVESLGRWVAVMSVAAACSRAPTTPPLAFADSAAYRTLKNSVAAFHEVDVDNNGYPDGLVFSREDGGFTPALFMQDPSGEQIRWIRDCKGASLIGERFEKLRWVRDGDARRLLVTATTEDPDELRVSFAVLDPLKPCTPLFADALLFKKPAGDVLSPGRIRIGLSVATDGTLVVLDRPTTTQLRGVAGRLDILTGVRLRRWGGSSATEPWLEGRRSLLQEVSYAVEWVPEAKLSPDAVVGGAVLSEEIAQFGQYDAVRFDPAVLKDNSESGAWKLRRNETGAVRVSAKTPFVLLELHHGCALGEPAELEITSTTGGSLFVTGGLPVLNGTFLASASGRQREGQPAVEVVALPKPVRTLELRLGPVEANRCVRELRTFGWRGPA